MTWQDGELLVQKHKAESQHSGDSYLIIHSAAERSQRQPAMRVRVLDSIGGALVAVGYRLQSRCEQMSITTLEPADGLRLSRNGSGPAGV